MRKLTAIMLALLMLVSVCLTACSDDSGMPPVGSDSDDAVGTDNTGDDTESAGGNEDNGDDDDDTYYPDPDADFGGYLAVGGENGKVYFDDIKVVSVQGGFTLIDKTFEDDDNNLEGFTFMTADGGTWGGEASDWVIETIETPAAKEGEESTFNNALTIDTATTGSMMVVGGADWNLVRFSAKIMLEEGAGGVKLYFGVKDEKNYYVLDIGDGDNTSVSVKHCVDGVISVDTIDLAYNCAYGEWFPLSVNMTASTVKIYVNGNQLFEAYKEVSADDVLFGGIGFGTWSTKYSIDNVKVTSYLTGDVIYENDFSNETLSDSVWTAFDANDGEWTTLVDGGDWHDDWAVVDNGDEHGNILKLDYVSTTMTGAAIILTESIGNKDWNNYIFEFDARRDGGAEGFMPYFVVEDVADPASADFIRWNQGGWTNTQTCFQSCSSGSLTDHTKTAETYENDVWYHVAIYVIGDCVYGCVNGQLVSALIG